MFNDHTYKSPSAFDTWEEYEEYCEAREAAESQAEDEAVERHYEKLYNE